MTDFGRRFGDMFKSTYDSNEDGVIAVAQTEADMKLSTYDPNEDGVIAVAQTAAVKFVARADPGAYDFDQDDLTVDNDWNDLDLSNIVTAGAAVVILRVRLQATSTGKHFDMRGYESLGTWTTMRMYSVEATRIHSQTVFLPLDSARVVQYNTNNTTFTYIWGVVAGWFI